jgi:hypothetical protein
LTAVRNLVGVGKSYFSDREEGLRADGQSVANGDRLSSAAAARERE